MSSGAAEDSCCCCSAGSKVRKRSGIGGLTSQLLLLVPLGGLNVGGQSSSCRFASPPPARATAHFRFRTRARTAAATRFPRPLGQPHLHRRRVFPPAVGGGWLRNARENVPSLPYTEEGGYPSSYAPAAIEPSFHGSVRRLRQLNRHSTAPSVESDSRGVNNRLIGNS